MTPSTTESTSSITARLRHRLETAQTRARGVPVSMRAAVDRMLERMRGALDLPSRTELQELTQRLEELDRKIAALAAERVGEMSRVVPALAERAGAHDEVEADAHTERGGEAEVVAEHEHEHEHVGANGADGDTERGEAEDDVTVAAAESGAGADPAQARGGKRNKRRLRKK